MRSEHIRTVQSTWADILPVRDVAARLLSEKLLETDPSLSCLYLGDVLRQSAKLVHVIDTVVNGLSRLEHNAPLVQRLGRRFAECTAKEHRYATIGAALLWMLGSILGDEFAPEVEDAWATVYAELAAVMRRAVSAIHSPQVLSTREPSPSEMA